MADSPGMELGVRNLNQIRSLQLRLVLGFWAASGAMLAAERYEMRAEHRRDGIGKFYLGREIAQVMGHQAADWLERPEREQEEEPSRMLEALKIKPGDVVADVGAGSGYLTFRMAKLVGPMGKVLAIDIQPEMLALLRKRIQERKVTNVELFQGTITDPKLPAAVVDLI